MPLVLRGARHARAQQAILATLPPKVEALKKRYSADPQRLFAETQALYAAHGVRLLSFGSLGSIAIQLPLLGALFSAVRTGLGERIRFSWIADLSRADALLALLVTSLTGFAAALGREIGRASCRERV